MGPMEKGITYMIRPAMQPGKRESSSLPNSAGLIQCPISGSTPSGVCVTVWNPPSYHHCSTNQHPTHLVLVPGDDPRLALHPGNVLRVRTAEVVVLVGRQLREHPTFNELVDDLLRLVLRTVADEHTPGAAQLHLFGHEALDFEGKEVEVALQISIDSEWWNLKTHSPSPAHTFMMGMCPSRLVTTSFTT